MNIGDYKIDKTSSCFVVAELSANHGHDIDIAIKTIEAAKKAGANAIKLQTYTADTLTINEDNEYFQIKQDTLWDGRTLYQLYQDAYTPWEWHPKLKQVAEDLGLVFFSSPFDKSAVDFLEQLNVPAYKIASFEINDTNLIDYTARKGKPIILSTGIATFDQIADAVNTCRNAGNNQIILLKCTSSYPAPIEEANLLMIKDLREKFDVIAGLSDHTLGTTVPVAAVVLGAKMIEKHFILDKSIGGPDAGFSLNPEEFRKMVDDVRKAELAVGKVNYELSERVKKNKIFARSLFIVQNISKGELLTLDTVKSIRPGYGISPKYLNEIIGKRVNRDLKRGTPMSWDYIIE